MRKGSIVLFFVLSVIIVISSCKSEQDKIGMLIASTVFEPNLHFFSNRIEQSGYSVVSANANYDDNLQILQAEELINEGVKVLVIIPVNTNTAAAIVRLANKRGIKTIAFERIISNCKLDYFISFDNVKIGEMLASEALKKMSVGDYFILNGDISDQNAVWVREGFYNVLEPAIKSGNVKVVFDAYIEDWMAENAAHKLRRYINLSGDVPDVILSAYNGMNNGLFEYFVKEQVSSMPLVLGQDIDTKEARSAKDASQKITLYKSPEVEAVAAADLAIKLLKNENVTVDQKINNGAVEVKSILIKEMSIVHD